MKKQLTKTRNGFVTVIFKGLAENKSIKEIFREIANIYPKSNRKLLQQALNLTKKAQKLVVKPTKKQEDEFGLIPVAGLVAISIAKKNKILKRSDVVFEAMKEIDFNGEMSKVENEIANEEETKLKEQAIDDDISQSRKFGRVFYLMSSHNDCADDHREYQGKIYYDRTWRNVIKDEKERELVLSYINQFKVRSLQWVLHRPVWLITRPNCRHFYKSIETEEVLKRKPYEEMVKDNDMHFNEGQKKTQTLKHSLNKDWYTRKNIENIIRQYEERRDYHLAMRKSGVKSHLLDEAIKKDNLLIKKWKNLLAKTTK